MQHALDALLLIASKYSVTKQVIVNRKKKKSCSGWVEIDVQGRGVWECCRKAGGRFQANA